MDSGRCCRSTDECNFPGKMFIAKLQSSLYLSMNGLNFHIFLATSDREQEFPSPKNPDDPIEKLTARVLTGPGHIMCSHVSVGGS